MRWSLCTDRSTWEMYAGHREEGHHRRSSPSAPHTSHPSPSSSGAGSWRRPSTSTTTSTPSAQVFRSRRPPRLGGSTDLVTKLVDATPDLVEEGPVIRRRAFAPEFTVAETEAWDAARLVLAGDLAVPRASTLGISDEVLHALIRRGDLVRIADDLILLPGQVETITSRLSALPDGFTVAAFRDEFGLARRHAVPLLEWLDAEGRTRRDGNGRSVRR